MAVEDSTGIRELTPRELSIVSGGDLLDSPAFRGGTIGGVIGSMLGAGLTGSSAGASSYGIIGAALGFSFGLGWGIGTTVYNYATRSPR